MSFATKSSQPSPGFSLVEVLITLGLIGILAAFTVPKVLGSPNSTQSSKYNAVLKDGANAVLAAYEQYRLTNTNVPSTFSMAALTPYLNYVKLDTTILIDSEQGGTSLNCADTNQQCLLLHNGGILWHQKTNVQFGGTSDTNAIYFLFDPDGKYSNTTNGPGKSVRLQLYRDGRITTIGTARTNSVTYEWGNWYTYNAIPTMEPPCVVWP
jgi:prepilin-type N-terminal cleavage/methylation domain-containing protein